MLFVRSMNVIADPIRDLLSDRNTFMPKGLRMFLRNDCKARVAHSQPCFTEDCQKTNGFSRKAEKYTSLSLAEKK